MRKSILDKIRKVVADRMRRDAGLKEKIASEIAAQHPYLDARIMHDGRPAYAWWNEILRYRSREKELQEKEIDIMERMTVLKIAEWSSSRDILTNDTFLVLRIKQPDCTAADPRVELLTNLDKYVSKQGGVK